MIQLICTESAVKHQPTNLLFGGCIYLVVSVCSLTFTKIGRD